MSADPDRIAAARLLLDGLGVTPDDLNRSDTTPNDQTSSMPTLASYLPRVIAAAGPGANRPPARTIYTRAIADNLIAPGASPAHRVAKPRRLPSTRRALTANELDEINTAARTRGNDVILDALLLGLHTETACRRGGALALRLGDLDTENCLIQLLEKGSTVRWQPVSPDLGRTPLRLRHRTRLRRTHQQRRPRHDHVHQGRPASRRHRPRRDDRATTPPRRLLTDSTEPTRTSPVACPGQLLATRFSDRGLGNSASADRAPDPERSTGCRDAARRNGDRSEEAVRRSATGQ
jgi:hypothetical protein